jgi:hypothetical protein
VVLQSVFYVTIFVPTALTAHCFLFLGVYFSVEKNKKQRAAPTAQDKKSRHKKLPEAKLHNVVLCVRSAQPFAPLMQASQRTGCHISTLCKIANTTNNKTAMPTLVQAVVCSFFIINAHRL